MRQNRLFLLLIFLLIISMRHLQAQTLQVELSSAPKVNRTTNGGTATIFFDSKIDDLSIICTEENSNEAIVKINDHQWFVNIDVKQDIEVDGICYRNYLLKCSASAEYFLTTDEISPNQVLYYTVTLPNELEPKLRYQEFLTEVAKTPTIMENSGLLPAYNHLQKLSTDYAPLNEKQKVIINNQMIILANATIGYDYFLHTKLECSLNEIDDMCIAPNDSLLAAASWYSRSIRIVDLYNSGNDITLDNFAELETGPNKMTFSSDSKKLWVMYGSYMHDNVEMCLWDLLNHEHKIIPIPNRIKNRIENFCLCGDDILVSLIGRKTFYLVNDRGQTTEFIIDGENITSIANINDSLCCISTKKGIYVYSTSNLSNPVLSYPLDFEYIKHLTGSGNRFAALYSNDTIVVYNAMMPQTEIIKKEWDFDMVYYEGSIQFDKSGDKLFALDGHKLYDLNFNNGNFRFVDFILDLGIRNNSQHGEIVTFKDKVIVSDANLIKIYAPPTNFKPGDFFWDGDVGYGHSSAFHNGTISRNEQLIFSAVGNMDLKKKNGGYIDNVIVISNFQKQKLDIVNRHQREITGVFYDEKTKTIYSCSLDSVLQTHSLSTKQTDQYKFSEELTCLIAQENIFYIGDNKGNVYLFKDKQVVKKQKISDYALTQIIIDNERVIIVGDNHGNLVLLDESLNILGQTKFSNSGITALAVNKDGQIFVGQRDGWVRVYEKLTLNIINSIKVGEQVSSISMNDIGQIVVCTTKHGYSDKQSSQKTYVLSGKDLMLLYKNNNISIPNKLWWTSNYELVGTNGIRFFTWKLPYEVSKEVKRILQ